MQVKTLTDDLPFMHLYASRLEQVLLFVFFENHTENVSILHIHQSSYYTNTTYQIPTTHSIEITKK